MDNTQFTRMARFHQCQSCGRAWLSTELKEANVHLSPEGELSSCLCAKEDFDMDGEARRDLELYLMEEDIQHSRSA